MSEIMKPTSHVRAFDMLTAIDRLDYEDLINGESDLGTVRITSQNDFPIGGASSAVMRVVDFTSKPIESLVFNYEKPIC